MPARPLGHKMYIWFPARLAQSGAPPLFITLRPGRTVPVLLKAQASRSGSTGTSSRP